MLFRVSKERKQLIAPIEIERDANRVRLFNSLRVRSYTNPRDIEDIFTVLAPQGMIAEVAVNKARVDGDRFDLRIVVIAGRADHVVARQSSSPITNLHLGNARASLVRVEEAVGTYRLHECRQLALRTTELFPRALYFGVDICCHERDYRLSVKSTPLVTSCQILSQRDVPFTRQSCSPTTSIARW